MEVINNKKGWLNSFLVNKDKNMKLNKKVLYSAVLALLMLPGVAVLADRGGDDFRKFDRDDKFRKFDDDRRFFNRGFDDRRFFNDRVFFNRDRFVNPFFHNGFGGLGFHDRFDNDSHDD